MREHDVDPAMASGTDPAPGARPADERAPATSLQRAGLLLGPPAAVVVIWWCLGLWTTRTIANEALAAGGIFLTFVGPSVIFGPAVVGTHVFEHLTTWDLVAVTAFFSLAAAFFYAFNLDLLERVPRLGPWLHRVRGTMREILAEKPWIRRWTLLGVGLFVVLPLPGSGTLGGSIMARIIGLSRTASCVVVGAGSLVVCLLYGWFGEQLRVFGDEHELPTWAKVAGALAFVGAMALLGRWLARRPRPGPEPPAARRAD
jgi:uncharacterized membrane protein